MDNQFQINKLFFEFTPQETLNILEALSLYQKLVLPEKYRYLIDIQTNHINQMLKLQNVDTYHKNDIPTLSIGSIVKVDISIEPNKQNIVDGILLGTSDIENLFKVVIIDNNNFKFIDVPINVIKGDINT